jgi:hypothetical protein
MTEAREERERRLSAALRANLKRRKAQARERGEGEAHDGTSPADRAERDVPQADDQGSNG